MKDSIRSEISYTAPWLRRLQKIVNILLKYIFVFCLVLLAAILKYEVDKVININSFIYFTSVIILSASLFGIFTGLFSLFFSVLILFFFFLDPINSFIVESEEAVRLLIFIFQSAIILMAIDALRNSKMQIKKAKEFLENERFKVQKIIDTLYVFIVLVTPEGEIIEANKATNELEKSNKKIIGKNITNIYPWSYSKEVVQKLRNAITEAQLGERIYFDEKMRIDEDSFIDVYISVTPIFNKKNEVESLIVTATDISDTKHLEEKKRDFISIVGHELKTPLTSLKGYVQLLRRNEMKDGEKSEFLSHIDNQLVKIDNLIENIQSVNDDSFNLNQSNFDLNSLTAEIVDDYLTKNKKKEINLNLPPKNQVVNGDKVEISKVINQLISNSVRYSPKSEKINIYIEDLGKKVRFKVEDFGVGIPEKEISKLFQKFSNKNSNKFNHGVGLGLYLSNEIMKKHGSVIKVKSEVGVGSTFYFDLLKLENEKN